MKGGGVKGGLKREKGAASVMLEGSERGAGAARRALQ